MNDGCAFCSWVAHHMRVVMAVWIFLVCVLPMAIGIIGAVRDLRREKEQRRHQQPDAGRFES